MDFTMARDRGKKALYEVMSKGRIKPSSDGTLKQKQPKRPVEDRPPVDKPKVEEKSAVEKAFRSGDKINFVLTTGGSTLNPDIEFDSHVRALNIIQVLSFTFLSAVR